MALFNNVPASWVDDAARLSVAAYADNAGAIGEKLPGWSMVTDLPVAPGGFYSLGNAQGFVASREINGTKVIALTFRGSTFNPVDLGEAITNPPLHYVFFAPLVAQFNEHLTNHTEYNNVLVSGHSLGGAMTELYMAGHSDARYIGVTFASVTRGLPLGRGNIVNLQHTDDIVQTIDGFHLGAEIRIERPGAGLIPNVTGHKMVIYESTANALSNAVLAPLITGIERVVIAPDTPNSSASAGGLQGNYLIGQRSGTSLVGGAFNDFLEGNGSLKGGGGNDRLLGSGLLHGESGADFVEGQSSDDTIYGGNGADTLRGGGGADLLFGDKLADDINGNGGDDVARGGEDGDTVRGGQGNDLLYGDSGADSLFGDVGNDRMYGGTENDTLLGGSGNDTLLGDSGNDRLYGGTGNDTLFGGADNDTLSGDTGADFASGGTGNDQVYGGQGNDTLYGGDGSDTLSGEAGADRLIGDAGGDQINGGQDNDTVSGGIGNDTLSGDLGADSLAGDDGSDRLYGGSGNDIASGGADSDTIYGGNDRDTLYGGSSGDVLYGDLGNDRLQGDGGNDTLTGGAGADTLVFRFGDNSDLIRDFSFGEGDRIALQSGMARTVRSSSGSALIDFGNGDSVTLSGISSSSVRDNWFFILD